MVKYSCLDCKNYKRSKTKVVGMEETCGGMVLEPITKEFPHHCDAHPRYFNKWWKENGDKVNTDIVEPKCLVLHDHLATLNKCIDLAKDILKHIESKKNVK